MLSNWAVALAVVSVASPVAAPPELEVQASLSGFNLLWPTSRCCAFTLHLAANGELVTTLQLEGGPVTTTSRLTADEVSGFRHVLEDARFFSLPHAVGPMPVDGDEHEMRVRLGSRSRTVTLFDWPDDWEKAPYLSRSELERTRRAYVVWSALRALVKDARATVP
jgi:hypothetical protein